MLHLQNIKPWSGFSTRSKLAHRDDMVHFTSNAEIKKSEYYGLEELNPILPSRVSEDEIDLNELERTEALHPNVQFPSAPTPWHLRANLPLVLKNFLLKRLGKAPPHPVTLLNNSFNPKDTLKDIRSHKWTLIDVQYVLLLVVGLFNVIVIQKPGIILKLFITALLLSTLIFPALRQGFLPFLPIAVWLTLFYSCGSIPTSWRPNISVRVLPATEHILYGASLSDILAKNTNTFLDIMAWIPYGLVHFGAPFFVSIVLFFFGPPGMCPCWARSFGYMNIIGVIIQILFPCAPPWYETKYGLVPANYGMKGSPGGLARIDQIFGGSTYTTGFTNSPQVFGAFPSLHSGSATIEALVLSHAFPKLRPYLWTYVLWIWWSTMYLTHHYFFDLIGGSCLSVAVFYVAVQTELPQIQPGKLLRWEYDYVLKMNHHNLEHTAIARIRAGSIARDKEVVNEELENGTDSSPSSADDVWSIGSNTFTSSSNTPAVDVTTDSSDECPSLIIDDESAPEVGWVHERLSWKPDSGIVSHQQAQPHYQPTEVVTHEKDPVAVASAVV